MKTDMELREDVVAELAWEPSIDATDVAVGVSDGVVTLAGTVKSYAQKIAAERAVERLAGVKALANELTVLPPLSMKISDSELAHRVVNTLGWNIEVPDTTIRATVQNGWVTLEGQVEWQYQKNAAERSVRYLPGVTGLRNWITVRQPSLSPTEVRQLIKAALHRKAEVDANAIAIDVTDGRVTLRGTVKSLMEREEAERAAWAAPGVTDVQDLIAIT